MGYAAAVLYPFWRVALSECVCVSISVPVLYLRIVHAVAQTHLTTTRLSISLYSRSLPYLAARHPLVLLAWARSA